MTSLYENKHIKVVGYSGEIDALGPFAHAPADNISNGVGIYTYIRVIEGSEANTITGVGSYKNCHPEISRMGPVDFVILENNGFSSQSPKMVVAARRGKINSSDLDAVYLVMDQARMMVKSRAKIGYLKALIPFIMAIPLMITLVLGVICLVCSFGMFYSTWRTKTKNLAVLDAVPQRSEFEPLLRDFFNKTAAVREAISPAIAC